MPGHPLPPIIICALVGDTLISLLRQIRAGYTQRPQAFPTAVILCNVRDVRDYRNQLGLYIHTNIGRSAHHTLQHQTLINFPGKPLSLPPLSGLTLSFEQ